MTRRRDELLRALGAGAALAGLVVGVPIALAAVVGWPLPRGVPTWDGISRALEGGEVPDAVWLKAIACVVWAAWAQFTASVVVEATAAMQGRMARRLPGVPGSAQLMASRLVTTVAVVVASLGARPEPVAHAAPVAHLVAVTNHVAPAIGGDRLAVAASPAPAPSTPDKTWLVQRRDSLWSIAERTLGSGDRYGEIFELNRGRPQPDGRSLVRPDVIEPGWTLLLPPDAAVAAPAGTKTHTVAPGETLWEIAETSLGAGERSGEVFQLNRGRPQPDGRALDDPDLIRPGWVLELPTAQAATAAPVAAAPSSAPPAPPPVAEAPASSVDDTRSAPTTAPDAAPPPTPIPTAPPSDAPEQEAADDDADLAIPSVLVGGLALGGVALAIDRLRRVQQRRRRTGRRIALPEQGSAAERAETTLRARAAVDVTAAVDAAMRRLTAAPVDATDARLTVARVDGDVVVLNVAGSGPAPPGVAVDHDGWRLAPEPAAPIGPSAAPALAAVGSDARGEVLVDLEAAGVLAVTGDDGAVRDLMCGLAVSMATAPWSDDAEVVLVGVYVDLPLPWVRRLDSLEEALDAAEARIAETADALRYAGVATTLAGRMSGITTEAWEPLVVVADRVADEDAAARLAAIARRPNCGVAFVVRGELSGVGWQAHVSCDRRLRLPDIALDADFGWATRAMTEASAELLALARDDADRPPAEVVVAGPSEAVVAEPSEAVEEPHSAVAPADSEVDVEVLVLGNVEIVRADGEAVVFERSKSAEAVAYLALHPGGVTKDPLQFALWPEGDNAEGTWHHTISKARRALGDGADGVPLFPPVSATGGIYRLASGVRTDYARFSAFVEAARALPHDEARPLLEEALGLVRGEPIMSRGAAYAWRAGLAATIEAEVVDAAERLGELCLDDGDPRDCEWAARQALRASPYDERLYRLLMRAADAAGNSAGVHKVLQELAAKLELDVEPLDGVHPETVELFEELTARRGRASA